MDIKTVHTMYSLDVMTNLEVGSEKSLCFFVNLGLGIIRDLGRSKEVEKTVSFNLK